MNTSALLGTGTVHSKDWTYEERSLRIQRLSVGIAELIPGMEFRSRNLMTVVSLCGNVVGVVHQHMIACFDLCQHLFEVAPGSVRFCGYKLITKPCCGDGLTF